MNQNSDIGNRHLASYLTLRKGIGCLGTALPFILAFGGMLLHGPGIRSSISAYYHTGMGDVFVGIICAIGIFLFSYKGYEPKDDRAGDFACLCAVGLALFPTYPDAVAPSWAACLAHVPNLQEPSGLEKITAGAHGVFAAGFFLTLTYFSLVLFTKSDPKKKPTRKKLQRILVYKACGYVMLLAIALIALGGSILYLGLLPDTTVCMVMSLDPLFWLESIAIVAFGFSWLVKGEAILKDET
jgi:hypothetical protein